MNLNKAKKKNIYTFIREIYRKTNIGFIYSYSDVWCRKDLVPYYRLKSKSIYSHPQMNPRPSRIIDQSRTDPEYNDDTERQRRASKSNHF
jgi:hypothetical protein